MLYVLFWVIPRRLNFIRRRFGILYLFHLHRQEGELFNFLPMKMEQIEYSETSAYKIQTPGNYPEENIQQGWYPLNMRLGGPHKSVWTTWKEKNPNLPDRPSRNVHFTSTKMFRLQLRFSFNWDMATCRWMFCFSRVKCLIGTGFGRLWNTFYFNSDTLFISRYLMLRVSASYTKPRIKWKVKIE
jgi:hypothetical protein